MQSASNWVRLGAFLRKELGWRELYHEPQGEGKHLNVAPLGGYFIDFSSKVRGLGCADAEGVPTLPGPRGKPFYHPVTICEWGLGQYDAWLGSDNSVHRDFFLRSAHWLVRHQDDNGGWVVFDMDPRGPRSGARVGIPAMWHDSTSRYSALAQGLALSILARAGQIEPSHSYVAAAESAFELASRDTQEDGVCLRTEEGPCMAEVVSGEDELILNGWMFALFGIWDHWLATREEPVRAFFEESCDALLRDLSRFDLGWWSAYDLHGNVAKPFYHSLHSAQLLVLSRVYDKPALGVMAKHWADVATPRNALRASVLYGSQRVTRTLLRGR